MSTTDTAVGERAADIGAAPRAAGGTNTGSDRHRWRARPALAWALRTVLMLVPCLAAAGLTFALGRRIARPAGLVPGAAWWVCMLLLATACYVLVERATRRLLPLAALLRLSLVFPDRTPSRYGIALRAGSTKRLQATVERARSGVLGDTPDEAAETALVLIAALNRHDRLTRGHSERVRALAEVIGEGMGLDPRERELLRWSALLHDIGKLCVPSEILNKPGRLTDEEFDTIKRHPEDGERLVAPLIDWLGESANAIGQHHERFDGGGYPRGLAGAEIGLPARIVAVADTFDVITSARSYKRPMSAAAGRRELARCSGTQFDPKVVRALLDVSIGRLWLLGGPLTWLTSAPLLSKIPLVHPTTPSLATLAPAVGNLATAGIVVTSVLGVTTTSAEPTHEVVMTATPASATHDDAGRPGGRVVAGADAATSDHAARERPGEAGTGAGDASPTAPDGKRPEEVGADGTGSTDSGAESGSERRDVGTRAPEDDPTAPSSSTTAPPAGRSGPRLTDTVTEVVDGVGQTVEGVGGTVDQVVDDVTDVLPGRTGDTVDRTVDGVTDTVGGTVDGVTKGIGGLFGRGR